MYWKAEKAKISIEHEASVIVKVKSTHKHSLTYALKQKEACMPYKSPNVNYILSFFLFLAV